MAVEVEEAAVVGRSDPGHPTPTQCSCRPVPEIYPSVGAAKSCSMLGHLCSG